MKNLFLLFILTPIFLNAQIKVHSTGNVSFGGENTPRAVIDINRNTNNSTTAQFGSFGIQSNGTTNGFLTSNGFWNGPQSGYQAYADGAVNMIQFNNNLIRLRTTPSITAGSVTSDVQNNLTAAYGASLGGIVGINTMTPSGYNLYVQGTAFKSDGNSSWSVVSDRRLKQNIHQFNRGLDIVEKINVVEFEYNGIAGTKRGDKHIGIVAQEIQEIAPFMVSKTILIESSVVNDNTQIQNGLEYLTFNDSSLPFLLVNAIKEQQNLIKELKNELNNLKLQQEEILKKINNPDNQTLVKLK